MSSSSIVEEDAPNGILTTRIEGELVKRAGFLFKSWETRFVRVVVGDNGVFFLEYFSRKPAGDEEPKGRFPLANCSLYRAAEGKIASPTPYCMEIHPHERKLEGRDPFYFCADNEKEFDRWMQSLNSSITSSEPVSRHGKKPRSKSLITEILQGPSPGDDEKSIYLKNMRKATIHSSERDVDVLNRIEPRPEELDGMKTVTILLEGPLERKEISDEEGCRREPGHAFLLKHALLLTDPISTTIRLRVHVNLFLNPRIRRDENNQRKFKIFTKTCGRTYELTAPSTSERDEWCMAICKAMGTDEEGARALSPPKEMSFATSYYSFDDSL